MKHLIIIALVLLASCTNAVKIGDTEPCVVKSISGSAPGMVWYKTTTGNIKMPQRLYNVGDTVHLYNMAVVGNLYESFSSPTYMLANTRDTAIPINHVRVKVGLTAGFNKDTLIVDYDYQTIMPWLKK